LRVSRVKVKELEVPLIVRSELPANEPWMLY
jgi:hypothetical protein